MAIGTEEILARKLRLQRLESVLDKVLFAAVTIGRNALLKGVEKGHILALQRYDFIAEMNEERLLLNSLFLCDLVDARGVVVTLGRGEVLPLVYGAFYALLVYRFQQVVDAVYLECLDGILIVGGSENYRGFDLHAIEDAERGSIGQMNIHKDEVELWRRTEKLDAVDHSVNSLDNLHIGTNLV